MSTDIKILHKYIAIYFSGHIEKLFIWSTRLSMRSVFPLSL